jgi:hypothetical protein
MQRIAPPEGVLPDALDQLGAQALGIFERAAAKQQAELIAAQAPQQIGVAQLRQDASRSAREWQPPPCVAPNFVSVPARRQRAAKFWREP